MSYSLCRLLVVAIMLSTVPALAQSGGGGGGGGGSAGGSAGWRFVRRGVRRVSRRSQRRFGGGRHDGSQRCDWSGQRGWPQQLWQRSERRR